jgi:hypothetical protein
MGAGESGAGTTPVATYPYPAYSPSPTAAREFRFER